jgi:hypothetical protein
VRVPVDAVPGKAFVRFELPKDSGYLSTPTDLPVELVAERESTKVDGGDDGFLGKWANVDEKTAGLTRIEVSKNDDGWKIQAWGAAAGKEIDQGSVVLHLLGDTAVDATMKYGFASWDHNFKEMHLTLRLENVQLIVEDFNIFKDKSRRSNYRSRYEFKKER